jgi:hypothetical protein
MFGRLTDFFYKLLFTRRKKNGWQRSHKRNDLDFP